MITLHQFQTARMERWLAERDIDLAIRPPEIEHGAFEKESSTYDLVISAGQIRLLPIWMCGPVPRCLVYAAVLEALPDNQWKVALFSPYGEPANQNELRTSFAPDNEPPDLALRTLCLWNAFPIPSELLAKSWIIHELPPADIDALSKIQAASLSELDTSLRLRLGPPPEIAAFAAAELNDYMFEEEKLKITIRSHSHARVKPGKIIIPRLWSDIVTREAGPMEREMIAYASCDFAVWMTDVPAKVFAKKATDPSYPTPLTLLAEATDFWRSKDPIITQSEKNRFDLLWKTEAQIEFEQADDFYKMTLSHFSASQAQVRYQPQLPYADALLYDGSTARLIGKGTTSPSGLHITLKSKNLPQGPLQVVLCHTQSHA